MFLSHLWSIRACRPLCRSNSILASRRNLQCSITRTIIKSTSIEQRRLVGRRISSSCFLFSVFLLSCYWLFSFPSPRCLFSSFVLWRLSLHKDTLQIIFKILRNISKCFFRKRVSIFPHNLSKKNVCFVRESPTIVSQPSQNFFRNFRNIIMNQ